MNSTFSLNLTSGGDGGGGGFGGSGTVIAGVGGIGGNAGVIADSGGLDFDPGIGSVSLANITITENSVTAGSAGAGGFDGTFTVQAPSGANGGVGTSGLVVAGSAVRLDNSIVAGNHADTDIAGTFAAPSGFNLIGNGDAGNLVDGLQGNRVGSLAGAGVVLAGLGPLADNGGLTETHAPQTGSPAIDSGDNTRVPGGVTTDQRGPSFPRIVNVTVDKGAVEFVEFDFGDAPDPAYPTLSASNGARHVLGSGLFLGATVDAENDGQPDATATGDDLANQPDEDGVVFTSILVPGTMASVTVTASAVGGLLDAWIDFNNNGSWLDAGEQIFMNQPLAAGPNPLVFPVPPGAALGPQTFARFRLSAGGNLSPTGIANDGEVEDYALGSIHGQKFDDLNGDGKHDPTEPGLDDFEISIVDIATGTVTATVTTMSMELDGTPGINPFTEQGVYWIPGIPPDEYLVFEEPTAEHLQTFPPLELFSPGHLVDVGPGETIGVAPAEAEPVCGPGAHWVDACGTPSIDSFFDVFFSSAVIEIEGDVTSPFGEFATTVFGSGTTKVQRGQPQESGTPGHNDTIPLEMVSLELTGSAQLLGVDLRLRAGVEAGLALPTLGLIQETGDPAVVDSFFDVFFEVETPLGTLHNIVPLTVQAAIDRVIPYQVDFVGQNPVQLFGPFNIPTGITITNLTHTPIYGADFGNTEADFGDAPDPSYATLLLNNGPRHLLGSGLFLGATVDPEPDGQPDPAALGDDLDSVFASPGNTPFPPGDEDGVINASVFAVGEAAFIDVVASGAGLLDAWLDVNGNGTFDHPAELLTGASVPLLPGPNTIPFTIPGSAIPGTTYARLRFSTAGSLPPTGPAADGEVEDYQVEIYERDFGDAPDPTFSTLLASNGPRHPIVPGAPTLGASIDADSDGQPDSTATGDDNDGNNDEDGLTSVSALLTGLPASMNVAAPVGGQLDAWLDTNGNGVFDHPSEHINSGTSVTLTPGANVVNFTLPANAVAGLTFARLRISSSGGLAPTGPAQDGEVEDYEALIERAFVVNSAGDLGDSNLSDNVCDTGGTIGIAPECTLRAAIEQANASANAATGLDRILFSLPGAGVHTTTPGSALPSVTEAVIIDGTSQPGYGGTPLFEIDGSGAGAGAHGLSILSGNTTIRGLAINRFAGSGIRLLTGGGNTLAENSIGTNPAGSSGLANGAHGVLVFNSAGNLIGGSSPAQGNVISGNGLHGVFITRSGSTGNVLQNNLVGLASNGVTPIGNGGSGVRLDQGAAMNDIGDAGIGNVISGNAIGVFIGGAATTNNTVAGNQIGTDLTGLIDRGNSGAGVVVEGSPGNVIGVPGEGNLIAGNNGDGVFISGSLSSGNLVQANQIGVDITGNAGLQNNTSGVTVFEAPNNRIGGTGVGAGNLVSGNKKTGIFIVGNGASGNQIEGNFVGTNAAGNSPVPNGQFGVVVRDAPANIVGGSVAGAGNVVSGNTLDGVAILLPAATGNHVAGNLIGTDPSGTMDVGNGNSGVLMWQAPGNTIGGLTALERNIFSGNDLFGVRVTTPAAANNVVQGNFIGTDITGMAALPNSDSGVQLANAQNVTVGGNSAAARNVISGNGNQGIVLIGAGVANNRIQGNFIGVDVTGTAALGNTNIGVRVGGGARDNTIGGDATAGEGNVISGNGGDGVVVTDSNTRNTTIAGNVIGTDITGTVDLGNGNSGVSISGAHTNTVGGLTTGSGNLISGNGLFGISIAGATATGNHVQGNAIGTDISGTADLGNASTGVLVSSSSNTIGGTAAGAGNLISGNDFVGVRINGSGATGNAVQGNLIGVQSDGMSPLANTGQGVRIDNGSTNTVGGTVPSAGNVIAHNSSHGVAVIGATATGNAIERNSMFSNGALGIDLGLDGVTANDVIAGSEDIDSGPNRLQNFPDISVADLIGNTLSLTYSVSSNSAHSAYPLRVEFFLADGSGFEGQTFLGADSYTVLEALGTATVMLDVTGMGVSGGSKIVATATDSGGNSSEFSAPATATVPVPADSGEVLSAADAVARTGESIVGVDELSGVTSSPTGIAAAAVTAWRPGGVEDVQARQLSPVATGTPAPWGSKLEAFIGNAVPLDPNTAGFGWYVDATGLDAAGFARPCSPDARQLDLLSFVADELGHLPGLDDVLDDGLAEAVMTAWLDAVQQHRVRPRSY